MARCCMRHEFSSTLPRRHVGKLWMPALRRTMRSVSALCFQPSVRDRISCQFFGMHSRKGIKLWLTLLPALHPPAKPRLRAAVPMRGSMASCKGSRKPASSVRNATRRARNRKKPLALLRMRRERRVLKPRGMTTSFDSYDVPKLDRNSKRYARCQANLPMRSYH